MIVLLAIVMIFFPKLAPKSKWVKKTRSLSLDVFLTHCHSRCQVSHIENGRNSERVNNAADAGAIRNITGRLHGPIVGPTGRSDPGYVRLSVRPVGQTVGQTVAEPPT